MHQSFKLRLSFVSLVYLMTLVGFCAGVVSIPILIGKMVLGGEIESLVPVFLVFASPIAGVINGALFGVLAYPLYSWISKRIGLRFKGEVYETGD